MIDLHCHILPGVDDGSSGLRESLMMADIALGCGVSAIVATPHCEKGGAERLQSAVALLGEALEELSLGVSLLPGMEILGTPETAGLLEKGRLLTLNGSRYPLIEFPFFSGGEAETEILSGVIAAGFRPVIAHPERCPYIRLDPSPVNRWVDMGCLLQIDGDSFLGRFGTAARDMAFALTVRGFVTAVASDAHSCRQRRCRLDQVSRLLSKTLTPDGADRLLRRNPQAIIRDETLPPVQPEWF